MKYKNKVMLSIQDISIFNLLWLIISITVYKCNLLALSKSFTTVNFNDQI